MAVRVFAAFGLIAALSGCGGNPWIPGGVSDGETVVADGVVNGVTINAKVQGNMNSVTYATGNNPITVNMTAQDSAALNGQYTRNPQFDVAGYKAYTHQQSTSNRYVVVLVADTLSSAKAMIAMDSGQFSNSHAGGLYSRAEAFVKPVTTLGGGAQPTFNYSGTYAGMLNWGVPTAGGPGGILNPTRAYQTSGEVLITADFIEMNISGGIQNRKIIDTNELLADIAFKETTIDGTGNFVGTIERLDDRWTTAGDYAGIIAGPNGSQIATLLRFQPIADESALYEQGIFVSASCTEAIPTGPACSQ